MIFANGNKYDGDFLNDKMSGKGTYTDSESSYIGDFQDGKKHGQGI